MTTLSSLRASVFAVAAAATVAVALVFAPSSQAASPQVTPLAWDAVSVGLHGRSVRVWAVWGICGRVVSSVHETPSTVTINLVEERTQPSLPCAAVARVGLRDIPLLRPLAGRRIVGPSRQSPQDQASVSIMLGRVMPRLIGFAAFDAAHVIALLRLRQHTRIARHKRGLPRVLAQFPAPGQHLPTSGEVRLALAE
jgi:hypothetical protein